MKNSFLKAGLFGALIVGADIFSACETGPQTHNTGNSADTDTIQRAAPPAMSPTPSSFVKFNTIYSYKEKYYRFSETDNQGQKNPSMVIVSDNEVKKLSSTMNIEPANSDLAAVIENYLSYAKPGQTIIPAKTPEPAAALSHLKIHLPVIHYKESYYAFMPQFTDHGTVIVNIAKLSPENLKTLKEDYAEQHRGNPLPTAEASLPQAAMIENYFGPDPKRPATPILKGSDYSFDI